MKKLCKYMAVVAIILSSVTTFVLCKDTQYEVLQEQNAQVIEIVRKISEETMKGNLPSIEKIMELKNLQAYIPKHYRELKRILQDLPDLSS